jgi:hypothetical protein
VEVQGEERVDCFRRVWGEGFCKLHSIKNDSLISLPVYFISSGQTFFLTARTQSREEKTFHKAISLRYLASFRLRGKKRIALKLW